MNKLDAHLDELDKAYEEHDDYQDSDTLSDFWKKVVVCEHKNMSKNYHDSGGCGTPYCDWSEERCNDCKVYIRKCGCGHETAMCGWPLRRWYKAKGWF